MSELKQITTLLNQQRQQLGMETAIVSHIAGGEYEIVAVDSIMNVFNPGDTFPLNDTYCSAVCECGDTITYTNVGKIEKMQLHPVYVMMQLESYIGVPLCKNDKVWGTVNFSSTEIRSNKFSEDEIKATKALAEQIQSLLKL